MGLLNVIRALRLAALALRIRDHAISAQLLDPQFQEVEQPRDHARRLVCRRHVMNEGPQLKPTNAWTTLGEPGLKEDPTL